MLAGASTWTPPQIPYRGPGQFNKRFCSFSSSVSFINSAASRAPYPSSRASTSMLPQGNGAGRQAPEPILAEFYSIEQNSILLNSILLNRILFY